MEKRSVFRFFKSRFFFIAVGLSFAALAAAYFAYKYSKRKPSFDYVNMKQEKVSGLHLASDFIRGMLVYKPPGYDTAAPGKYPVIIYFHGGSANGTGTETELNKIIDDSYYLEGYTLPGGIEKNTIVPEVSVDGKTFQYLVISPQVTAYDYPTNYPDAEGIDELIDYVLREYKIDSSRIYLTGMSTGANIVIDYVASSVKYAQRVAAVSTASLCSTFDEYDQKQGLRPEYIAQAKLPIWFMNCREDTLRVMACPPSVSASWVKPIVEAGGVQPRFTIFCPKIRIFEIWKDRKKPLQCASMKHNTWSMMYRPGFNEDGGEDLYHWLIKYRR